MKKNIFLVGLFTITAAAAAGSAGAQDLRGTVRDTGSTPLVGASVYWAGTTVGVSTDAEGRYQLHRVKGYDRLVASYLGFVNDTIAVDSGVPVVDFALEAEGVEIENVVVEGSMSGNFTRRDGIVKQEMISFAGLCKMACCNLAESFENSASVTVGYSDAVTGARQIKMLGLAGTYTQILDENRTIMRGLSSPYGLSYTPGMWLSSIQVSKGVASVTAGHEAITGQINLEYRKPTDDERLFVNLYTDEDLRFEGNISSSIPVTRDGKLSTVILAHGSTDTDLREMSAMDRNGDGFRDLPQAGQINVANRWLYAADNGMQLRWGAKYVDENRLGGMLHYKSSMRDGMPGGMYGSEVRNRDANAYVKLGMPVGAAVYDADEQDEMRSNFALVADYSYYDTDSYFGLNTFRGTEHIGSLNAMYSHYFSYRNSMIFGVTGLCRTVEESAFKTVASSLASRISTWDDDYTEREIGAYAEYTYAVKDKFSLVAGLRTDYNSRFDRWLVTPRGHIRWSITPSTTLRASAGLGYRATNLISDNIGIMATGRMLAVDPAVDRMEKALTWGGSLMQTFHIVGGDSATLSFDFFRTQFYNSVVVSQEQNAGDILIYSTSAPSYTNTYQVDFNWTPVERLDIFATFRYTDSAITLEQDGRRMEVERPLVGRYKTLLNLQYATRFRRWTFDVTAQYNGACRLPYLEGSIFEAAEQGRFRAAESPAYPVFFAQVTRKIGKFDLYVGCENIADYRQKNPILNADAPFSEGFNSSVVWGPLMGRKIYAGLRFNLY